jgi:RimJ/RimL family protein N-acetyltransferase
VDKIVSTPADTSVDSCKPGFVRFDEVFLEKSWQWLRDPEIKRLTMTPDFTREEQRRWFSRLPAMTDYLIWGVACKGNPIGAMGLKHINRTGAEYWGYIGEKDYWNRGLGREMVDFALRKARELELGELHLKASHDNSRAIRLYTRAGFVATSEGDNVLRMRISLGGGTCVMS